MCIDPFLVNDNVIFYSYFIRIYVQCMVRRGHLFCLWIIFEVYINFQYHLHWKLLTNLLCIWSTLYFTAISRSDGGQYSINKSKQTLEFISAPSYLFLRNHCEFFIKLGIYWTWFLKSSNQALRQSYWYMYLATCIHHMYNVFVTNCSLHSVVHLVDSGVVL